MLINQWFDDENNSVDDSDINNPAIMILMILEVTIIIHAVDFDCIIYLSFIISIYFLSLLSIS